MFAHMRYLILAFFVVIGIGIVSTLTTPENMDNHDLMERASRASSSIGHFLRQNATCAKPEETCKDTCDCCQLSGDAYNCTQSGSQKICTVIPSLPISCPPRPPTNSCKPYNAECTEHCDCCQRDQGGKPRRVACQGDLSSQVPRQKCTPAPFAHIDCFIPPQH